MSQKITLGYRALVEAAERAIESVKAEAALELHGRPDVVLVDLRDIRELKREGRIPGAFHCPRGMLEFWIDPASPYFKPVFGEEKEEDFAGGASGTIFLTKNGDRYFGFTETGDLIIAKLSPKGYEEVSRAKLLAPTGAAFGRKVVWSHPAYANKCVFARNDKELVCASLAAE